MAKPSGIYFENEFDKRNSNSIKFITSCFFFYIYI